ncbi:MAG: hypothetical protein MR945_05760 [Agathobacter sp.]|nr:hypothetical protein [Agathobacter sp.]
MPFESVRDNSPSVKVSDTVTSMLPWVESVLKFCAIPLAPTATKVPPEMVAVPA